MYPCEQIEAPLVFLRGLTARTPQKPCASFSRGGYTVYVPALPGCVSEGDSLEQARQNIREAIELYLEPVDEPVAPEGGLVEEIPV